MSVRFVAGALGAVLLGVVGCSGASGSESGTSADEVNSGSNTDVQVISAKSFGAISWGVGGFEGFDSKKCSYSDRQPYTSSNQYTATAKADCTEALIGKLGASINRYVEPQAWIREPAPGGNVDYTSFRNWCGQVEVVVAVKAAAWDAASFKGIGFYADARAINDGQTRVFYDKSDTRLARIGEATLKNEGHQKVYLYKFAGAGPCEPNGSGDNPGGSVEFKPYVTFDGDHERWEAVQPNHKVSYRQTWERRGDLLD